MPHCDYLINGVMGVNSRVSLGLVTNDADIVCVYSVCILYCHHRTDTVSLIQESKYSYLTSVLITHTNIHGCTQIYTSVVMCLIKKSDVT